MGARHQSFAVAKVGSRYRVVAGVHSQWLSDKSAVRQCLQTLKFFQANAPILRQDLQHAQKVDWQSFEIPTSDEWEAMTSKERDARWRSEVALVSRSLEMVGRIVWLSSEVQPRHCGVPIPVERSVPALRVDKQPQETLCPMITTCLMVGAAKRPGEQNREHLLSVTTSLQQCDNDDGFSIFDITDPGRPRYCFVVRGYPKRYNIPNMTPMDYNGYLAAYKTSMCKETDPTARELEQYALIDVDALAGTWPNEKFRTPEALPHAQASEGSKGDAPGVQHSLRDNAMSSVISRALTDGNDELSWLADAEQLRDFADMVLDHLRAAPNALSTTGGHNLLCRALRGRQNIDLSMFDQLKADQVFQLVSDLQSSSRQIKLTLPHIKLTAEQVHQLAHAGNIVELRFAATEGLDLHTLTEALSGAQLDSISHPAIYQAALIAGFQFPEIPLVPAINSIREALRGASLCQAIFIATGDETYAIDQRSRTASGGVAWSKHFAQTSPTSGASPAGKLKLASSHSNVYIPLHDVAMSIQKLLPRLYTTFAAELLPASPLYDIRHAYLGLNLAMSLSIDDDGQIGPPPATLLGLDRSIWAHEVLKPIVPGKWTMLVCQESHRDKSQDFAVQSATVRHCFVTRDQDGELVCKTLDELLNVLSPFQGEHETPVTASELVARLKCVPMRNQWTAETRLVIDDCEIEEAQEALLAAEMFKHRD
ncbi:uncharacterized protein RHO25_007202 [Cercospora beticola]|nr:hypothetical protein RHO25_007202 [Cercospora beticola]